MQRGCIHIGIDHEGPGPLQTPARYRATFTTEVDVPSPAPELTSASTRTACDGRLSVCARPAHWVLGLSRQRCRETPDRLGPSNAKQRHVPPSSKRTLVRRVTCGMTRPHVAAEIHESHHAPGDRRLRIGYPASAVVADVPAEVREHERRPSGTAVVLTEDDPSKLPRIVTFAVRRLGAVDGRRVPAVLYRPPL